MLLFFFFFCCEISISQIPEYLDFFYFYEDKHGTNFFPTKEFVKLQFHSFKKLHEMVSQISVIYRTTAFVKLGETGLSWFSQRSASLETVVVATIVFPSKMDKTDPPFVFSVRGTISYLSYINIREKKNHTFFCHVFCRFTIVFQRGSKS